jgi:hypothetical protein
LTPYREWSSHFLFVSGIISQISDRCQGDVGTKQKGEGCFGGIDGVQEKEDEDVEEDEDEDVEMREDEDDEGEEDDDVDSVGEEEAGDIQRFVNKKVVGLPDDEFDKNKKNQIMNVVKHVLYDFLEAVSDQRPDFLTIVVEWFEKEGIKKISTDVIRVASKLINDYLASCTKPTHRRNNVHPKERFMGLTNAAETAFQREYSTHGGEDFFIDHLKKQKKKYWKHTSVRYPFFAILQSSGYGKSRMMRHIYENKTTFKFYNVVYVSLGKDKAYPTRKFFFKTGDFSREEVTLAFCNFFESQRDPSLLPTDHLTMTI